MIPFDRQLFIDTEIDNAQIRYPFFKDANHRPVPTCSTYFEDLIDDNARQATRYYEWKEERRAYKLTFRAKLKQQLLDGRSVSRFNDVSVHNRKSTKAKYKQIGAAITWAIVHDDIEDLLELLNEGQQYSSANKRIEAICKELLDIYRCSDCGEFFYIDELTGADGDANICQNCLDNYRWSECMSTYIHENNSVPIYGSANAASNGDSSDVATRRYARNNYYESDDGNFFFDDDDRYTYDNYHDDDDDENDGLSDYHNTRRNFVEVNESAKYPALGLELEIYCEERRDLVNDLRDSFSDKIIMEKDGSLDDYYGFEIISQPFGREEWGTFLPNLTSVIQDHAGIGYNEPAGNNYGIHLSIHRRHLSPLAEARISMFLVDEVNAPFVRAIAQRNQIYAPDRGAGMGTVTSPKLRSVSPSGMNNVYDVNGGNNSRRKIYGLGKYSPVNFKEYIAEFRIFQSTTNMKSIQKNLEFIWALHKWTLPASASGSSHSHLDFLKWLNQPQQRNEFPELVSFLSKRTFYGTNFPPLISPWHSLMTKPSQEEACESIAA
jgi:hypothetical protein